MSGPEKKHLRTVRSFVRRQGRLSEAQRYALTELWPVYGVEFEHELFDWHSLFNNTAPVLLDIGFGQGNTPIEFATHYRDHNVLGVEVHRPGVGHCLLQAHELQLQNLRIACGDVVEMVHRVIPKDSLQRVFILFPDPWHKKRHHKRRLIQFDFMVQLVSKLQSDGILHIATDWQDYAVEIDRVMQQLSELRRVEQIQSWRPVTKYEQRGLKLGHRIFDVVYAKQ